MVYADPSVTDIACQGLNGLKMGDRVLTVRRATEVKEGASLFLVTDQTMVVAMRDSDRNQNDPMCWHFCDNLPSCHLLLTFAKFTSKTGKHFGE